MENRDILVVAAIVFLLEDVGQIKHLNSKERQSLKVITIGWLTCRHVQHCRGSVNPTFFFFFLF